MEVVVNYLVIGVLGINNLKAFAAIRRIIIIIIIILTVIKRFMSEAVTSQGR